MKFNHLVKHDGVYYPIGTDVPIGIDKTEEKIPFSEKGYKKTDINRMSVAELKNFATNIGVEVTEESTGTALKELIIKELNL